MSQEGGSSHAKKKILKNIFGKHNKLDQPGFLGVKKEGVVLFDLFKMLCCDLHGQKPCEL